MEIRSKFILFSSSIFVFLTIPAHSATPCRTGSCHPLGPMVRFPFRLIDRQPDRCGYPGFDLRCNSRGETVLRLPDFAEFVVYDIDYTLSAVTIEDPQSCALENQSLAGSPFRFYSMSDYALLNCSGATADFALPGGYVLLRCFGGDSVNGTVVAAIQGAPAPPRVCRSMTNVTAPSRWSYMLWMEPVGAGLVRAVRLTWSEPACEQCEMLGRFCGYNSDSGRQIRCKSPSSSGIPRGAKYAITVGVGIPALTCVIALALYACGKFRASRLRLRQNSQIPTAGISYESMAVVGLDRSTIESYPRTVLGESRRLPDPSNVTCPICLCDYKPKDALRSIPECNHYFHVDCVDEWLRLNGTCPVCRNSPASSSDGTSLSSSVSLTTSVEIERGRE